MRQEVHQYLAQLKTKQVTRPTKSEQCLISLLPDDILQNALVILTGKEASQGESENSVPSS